MIRTGLARRVRDDLGNVAPSASGALGISSITVLERSGDLRTTTSAPPALMFSAVANSRRSLPFSSLLLTKTGMASGNRTHLRRSFSGWLRVKRSPQARVIAVHGHLMGQMTGIRAHATVILAGIARSSPEISLGARSCTVHFRLKSHCSLKVTNGSPVFGSAILFPSVAIRVCFLFDNGWGLDLPSSQYVAPLSS